MTAARREQRRLLGLRRAVHYTPASRIVQAPARPPASVIAGNCPIDRAICSIEAEREQAQLEAEIQRRLAEMPGAFG